MSQPDALRPKDRADDAKRPAPPDRKNEAPEDEDDLVDTMSEDSFPASDPPSHALPARHADPRLEAPPAPTRSGQR